MGIRISEMEEATTFGADDYVPIVTSGTNKKALGQKIKDFIAGFFVSKSGDTMTGDLNINSNNARTKYINPNMTLDTSANNGLSSDSSYGAYFTDKNGNAVGDVSMTTRSMGRNYAQLMARNKKTDGTAIANYIDVIADKDGSSSYIVSNPAAFRKAIDAINLVLLSTSVEVSFKDTSTIGYRTTEQTKVAISSLNGYPTGHTIVATIAYATHLYGGEAFVDDSGYIRACTKASTPSLPVRVLCFYL